MNWLSSLFRRRKQEQELDAELRFHLEQQIEDNIAAGMSPEEARRTATLSFGGLEQIKETCRDESSFVWIEQLGKDLGFVVRSLCRAPGFTAVVLLTLTIGIAAGAFIFRIVDQSVLFGQPYPRPEQLVLIGYSDKGTNFSPYISYTAQLEAYLGQTATFSEFAALKGTPCNVIVNGSPSIAYVVEISPDFFKTLGFIPAHGRAFIPEDYQRRSNAVVIDDSYWGKQFQRSPDVIGRTVLIDQQLCTIVGVMPKDKRLPYNFGQPEIYRPLTSNTDAKKIFANALLVGRLRDGVSAEQATAVLGAITLPSLPSWLSTQYLERRPVLKGLSELGRPELSRIELLAGVFLYLIACLNVINMMLGRLLNRRRELGIRLALGSTRWRVARLLALESGVLTLVAFSIVVAITCWVFPLLLAAVYNGPSAYFEQLDLSSLLCAGALGALASILIALVPSIQLLSVETNFILKDGGTAASEGRPLRQLRNLLVILQTVFAVILLIGSGLMLRTFEKFRAIDLGFDPVGRAEAFVLFPPDYVLTGPKRLDLFQRINQRLKTLPGVKSSTFGDFSLLNNGAGGGYLKLDIPHKDAVDVSITYAQPELYETAGLVLIKGRWLSGQEGVKEAVINETMARVRYGSDDPIGQLFKTQRNEKTTYQIVGVVKDVRERMTSPSGLRFYAPVWMSPSNITTITLRLDPKAWKKEFADQIRQVIFETDSRVFAPNIMSIDDRIILELWAENQTYVVLRLLSAAALCLVVVGLFSIVSYTVNSRMREFGVRLALGAQPKNLQQMIMNYGLRTIAFGLIVGVAGAFALTRFMQSLLYETTPYDPWVYGGVAIILLIATVVACWLPARRAAKADVAQLLRTE